MVLLSFSSSLAHDLTKCVPLNDEPCKVRPTLIGLNPVELKYYPFMISLNNITGSCNILSSKVCVPKETRDINVEAFNMITNKNEAKAMIKHISCNKNVQNVIQLKNVIIIHQSESKNYYTWKRDYSWIPGTYICENSKYLKSIAIFSTQFN